MQHRPRVFVAVNVTSLGYHIVQCSWQNRHQANTPFPYRLPYTNTWATYNLYLDQDLKTETNEWVSGV